MLGKAISITAHALGVVTVLGCAIMAQQMAASSEGRRENSLLAGAGSGPAAPAAPAVSAAVALAGTRPDR